MLALVACAGTGAVRPAFDHYAAGAMFENEGKLDQALGEYTAAHRQDPGSKEILRSLVKALFTARRFQQALPNAQKLVRLDPKDYNSWALLGNVYLQLGKTAQGLRAYERRMALRSNDEFLLSVAPIYESVYRFTDALAIWEKLSADNPGSAQLAFARANTLRKLKHYDQALGAYGQTIALDTSFALAYLGSGICYEQIRHVDSAAAMYERFLHYQPSDTMVEKRLVELYVRLRRFDDALVVAGRVIAVAPDDLAMHQLTGYVYYKTGRPDDALREFLTAVHIAPSDAYSLLHIGKIYADIEQYDTAEEYVKRAAASERNLSETWTTLGLLYYETKRYEEALSAFRRALKLKGNRADNNYYLGLAWEAKKNFPKALASYRSSLKFNSGNPRVLFSLGILYDRLKRREDAQICFRRVIEFDSTDGAAYNYLAFLFADRGDSLDEAERLITRALALEPDNGYYLDTRGWIYFKQGRRAEAIVELERAVGIVPDAVIYDHLGDVYDRLGRRDKALEAWEKGAEIDPKNESIIKKLGR